MKKTIWDLAIHIESGKGLGTYACVKLPEQFPNKMGVDIANNVIGIIQYYGYGVGNSEGKLISSRMEEEVQQEPPSEQGQKTEAQGDWYKPRYK